jgi:Prokaryotic homologs of the JAB domain
MDASEVCFLLSTTGAVLWADRSGDPAALPDSRDRWTAIWDHREHLAEIAHSHPRGLLAFSREDRSTRVAVEAALGRPLTWTVVTAERMLRARPGCAPVVEPREPWWVPLLRAASGIATAADDPWDDPCPRTSEEEP